MKIFHHVTPLNVNHDDVTVQNTPEGITAHQSLLTNSRWMEGRDSFTSLEQNLTISKQPETCRNYLEIWVGNFEWVAIFHKPIKELTFGIMINSSYIVKCYDFGFNKLVIWPLAVRSNIQLYCPVDPYSFIVVHLGCKILK